jgi:UDP-N-acetylglucosamine 2-epimerase (non-hydrolysing)
MLDQVLDVFQIQPDFDLKLMRPNQSLAALSSRLLQELPPVFGQVKPAICLVQGDTTTTFCGALSAFYAGVEIAHVEAGLRTFDLRNPFPEEMNRVLTSRLAALHFAATEGAARNLIREGISPERIEVTGNTGIDAVLMIRDRLESGAHSGLNIALDAGKKLIVVTAHRRESFGSDFENLCRAIARLAEREDVQIVWPVHRNPNVTGPVDSILRGKPNVTLVEPLDYLPFVDLMRRAYLLLTDSGGIQEEAPSLGIPVLVLRHVTERPEAVTAGTVKLVGTDPERILSEATRLLNDAGARENMARQHNPYGDGHAAARIVKRMAAHLGVALADLP